MREEGSGEKVGGSQQPLTDSKDLNRMDVTAKIAALAAEDRGVIHLKAFDLPVQEEQLVITAAGIRALGEVLARGYLGGR